MAKRRTVLFVATSNDKPAKSRGLITIAAGKQLSIRVPVVSNEGWLNEVVVNQYTGSGGGTPVAFTVEVLDSCVPFHNADNTQATVESAYNAAATLTVEHFRVVDQATATSGNSVKIRTADYGYPFQNADGNNTIHDAFLYLIIRPTAAGDETKWEASLTTTSEIG